jgi:hypothetical protein
MNGIIFSVESDITRLGMLSAVFLQLCHILEGGFKHFDVFSDKTLVPQPYLVTDALPFFQRLKLDSLQLTIMEEYILAAIAGDETVTAVSVQKPDYSVCH